MIDLHLHSTASDGILEPSDLVARAARGGLVSVALTDHDTLDGVPAALAAGNRHGIEVIPGVEISLDHDPGTFHMIGLFVDPEDGPLGRALARVREGRADRNRRLHERLAELGVPVSLEEVERHAGGDVIARPHFARAMLDRGYVGRIQEAFDRWLGKGAAAYVGRNRLPVREALDLVHGAGGVTVLCHPSSLGLDPGPGPEGELLEFVTGLKAAGLDAMEVRYGEPAPAREERLGEIAAAAGLLPSGGTDFHGHTGKDRRQGLSRGVLDLPLSILEALRDRAAAIRGERGG